MSQIVSIFDPVAPIFVIFIITHKSGDVNIEILIWKYSYVLDITLGNFYNGFIV